MRKYSIRGDFRYFREKAAKKIIENRHLMFSFFEDEIPFSEYNQKLFRLESIGCELWKDILIFPAICLISKSLFLIPPKKIETNDKLYKIKKITTKKTKKEIQQLISNINYSDTDSLIQLNLVFDKNYISLYTEDICSYYGIEFSRKEFLEKTSKLIEICREIKSTKKRK